MTYQPHIAGCGTHSLRLGIGQFKTQIFNGLDLCLTNISVSDRQPKKENDRSDKYPMRSEKIQREYTPLYKQFQIFDKSAFLVFPFFSHIYTFSAILSLALRDLGFRSISASSGTITLLLTGRRGAFIRTKKSC